MKSAQLYLAIILLITGFTSVKAQSDSVRTEYKVEDENISKDEVKRFIRYVTRANIEEKTLVKLGGIPGSETFAQNGRNFSAGLNTELTVEQKLNPSLSVLFGFDNQTNFVSYQHQPLSYVGAGGPSRWQTDRSLVFKASAKLAVRYYYTMNRRMKNGLSANNFSGVYIAIQGRRPMLYYYGAREYDLATSGTRRVTESTPLGLLNQPSMAFQWGIQQRLGRRGYVDANIGPEITVYDKEWAYNAYNNSRIQVALRINAIIGLGW